MLRWLQLATALTLGLLAATRAAEARVAIDVDLASQTMRVDSASGTYLWPISSARIGYRTPRGTFSVKRMEAMHRSHKYHNSPMPHSLFFTGGYAIHGTYDVAALGQPASHGCIRIAPAHAAALFRMVKQEGGRITVEGNAPVGEQLYASRGTRTHVAAIRHHRQPDDGDGLRGPMGDEDGVDGVGAALGYAPVVDPSFTRWLQDPAGY